MPKINKSLYSTLIHNGPVFPEPYQQKGYKVGGQLLNLLSEEMLFNFARYWPDSEYIKKKVFIPNFWACLKPELPKNLQGLSFPNDFSKTLDLMKKDQEQAKEEKKALSKEEKQAIREEKELVKKDHQALIDGQPVDFMFQVEAPAIIITRGLCPRLGFWKYRTQPEDIVINIVGGKVPQPPKGHKWGGVISDPTALNAFTYKVQVGPKGAKAAMMVYKKANFSAASSVKKECVQGKYDKSSATLKNWDKIQKKIMADMKSDDEKTRQCAMVAYLIQMTGIRVGIEKNLSKFADTVGISTLKTGNVKVWSE